MMFSKRSLEGELIIDHRVGDGVPGLPRLFERAIATCSHCQAGVVMNPQRTRSRAWCHTCDRYICDTCEALRAAPGYIHRSFEAFAEDYLTAAALGKELPKWPNV